MFTVNGVNATPTDHFTARLLTDALARSTLGWNLPDYRITGFQNPTGGLLSDLTESALQVINQVTGGVTQTSTEFADEIDAAHDRREQVIVTPHSQGNLITIEALKRVRYPECVGVVSIATPSFNYPSSPALLGMTAYDPPAFDVVLPIALLLSGSQSLTPPPQPFEGLQSDLSFLLKPSWNGFSDATALHLWVGHYLKYPQTRVALALKLAAVDADLKLRCGRVQGPAAFQATAGQTVNVPISVLGKNDVAIAGRKVTAVSVSDTAVAVAVPNEAGDGVQLTARRVGTVSLEVWSGPAVGTVGVTVSANPGGSIPLSEFVLIPADTFNMGSNNGFADEQPVHAVLITKPFYLQKKEVTQAQWMAVMGSNPSFFKGQGSCFGLQYLQCPVEGVSWNEIQTFISRLNSANPGITYRLPTEAEWEYAARAGSTGEYVDNLNSSAWYGENCFASSVSTHPVGSKQPNAWGLFDIFGNVAEAVSDWYDAGYYSVSPFRDPVGPSTGQFRMSRGGSICGTLTEMRSALRTRLFPGTSYIDLGLRLVRTQ
jgi:formylglycine-generating enzyme required for sulfatase activity